MYAYRPVSMRALTHLVQRETMGQQARFERFMARMMFIVASGKRIDADTADDFSKEIDAAYSNPFEEKNRKRQPQTAAEIKQYVLCLLEGKEWI